MKNLTENQVSNAKELHDAADITSNATVDEVAPSKTFTENKRHLVEAELQETEKKKMRIDDGETNVQVEHKEPLNEEELLLALKNQIEYYFSDENLRHDHFFNKKITENQEVRKKIHDTQKNIICIELA
jgi:hypothetical protein